LKYAESLSIMKYHSTRGGGGIKTFEEVLLSTYASDGGMWVPESLPELSPTTLISWSTLSFPEICAEIVHLYTDIDIGILNEMTLDAFKDFNHGDEPLPLRKYDDLILLDCSLGPTFAFKDVGLQVTGRLVLTSK
jgi:threonine synthase